MESKSHLTKNYIFRKSTAIVLVLILMTSLLAACSKGDSGSDSDNRVLRVGFLYSSADNEQYLRQQYTDSFELLNPDIEIQIVSAMNYDDQRYEEYDPKKKQPDPYESLKELLTGKNPVDVLMIDLGNMKRLVKDNMLKQLEPYIQDSEFDIQDIVPTVLEGIKDAGEGSLYGLAPTFSSSALFYNKAVFTEAGVPFPTDGMEWNELFTLAKRVTKGEGKERKFGLTFSRYGGDPYYDTQNYAAPLRLKVWDDKGEKMTVDTAQWAKVWKDVLPLYKEKIIPGQQDMNIDDGAMMEKRAFNPFQGDMFLSGRVAMTIGGYDYITELSRAKSAAEKNKNITPVDWDVVTVPTFPEEPNVGGNIYMNNLMTINAKAANSDDAWKFIEFNNSKEWAKLKSRSTYEMVSRISFLKPKDGADYNIKAFYTLKPVPPSDTDNERLYRDKPNIWDVNQYGSQLFMEVIDGKKSVEEALKEWQTKGDALLQKMKEDPQASIHTLNGGGVAGEIYK
ncbi:extracellular solute-binding protein [Paenibacillus oenotherae]|uniref:Extracellular solute-binding protein n=1 Tax=Paenibacillus oenotherae TaxID=1435645 RepID=A0ABS7D149_9BACL|nr:extracellular solute-binding protein [Paenibacillus oenotherae]MBW7473610.1 extracellular solute-binding protein [Paenibacillus oenotherae]